MRLAHKAEHAVALDTGAVVAVTLQGADKGDTTTLDETLSEAGMAVAEQVGREAELRPDDPPNNNRREDRAGAVLICLSAFSCHNESAPAWEAEAKWPTWW